MSKKLFRAFAVAALTTFALGTSAEANPPEKKQTKEEASEFNRSLGSQKSADLRAGKTLALTATLGPSWIGSFLEIGLAYHVDRDLQVEVGLGQFDDNVFTDFRSGTQVTLRGRYFAHESFFIQGGLGLQSYLNKKSGPIFCFDSCGGGNPSPTRFNDLIVSLGMGNRWQWEYLNLGITWVGWGLNVATLSSEPDGSISSGAGELRLLNLDVGVSF